MKIEALYLLALNYPGVTIMAIMVVAMLVVLAVLIARDKPMSHQAAIDFEDDDTGDYNWLDTTGKMPLEPAAQKPPVPWGRSGGNWWPVP